MKTQTAIKLAKDKASHRCQECGSKHKLQGHHEIPGDDDSLVVLCADCHSKNHPNVPKLLFLSSNHVSLPKASMAEIAQQTGITSKPILHSILHQKATGTYQRNQQIRRLCQEGESMAEVGRMFKLPRQTIRRIVNEPGG